MYPKNVSSVAKDVYMYICPYGCVYPMPAMFSKIITQWQWMYMSSHHIEAPNKDVYIYTPTTG